MIEIVKNALERLRMGLTEYKGKQYVDLRVYYQGDDGEWKPTKKGLTLSLGVWREFVDGIQKLGAELEEQGLLVTDE